ncbi:MAG: propionyl-CoA carboxylase, partial [Proteobacteria bacterium]|nr:propionyl-CoA carboxylase [Pseudomonadota bacterium]MBU1742718.1 propionyl-CoA carboxylase [Pseudomonadota bacterium]
MGEWMDGYLARLAQVRRANLAGGGPERLERQHDLGKLTARERIDRLVDAGSFEEIGSVVVDHRPPFDGRQRPSPSDGVVMGLAKVNGRPTAVWSLDFSVMSGSLGDQAAWKLSDLTQMAGQRRMPIIGLIDSAGQRLSFKGGDSGLNGVASFIKNYAQYSGAIPRIALVLGPCVGLLSLIGVLSDFLI